MKRLLLGVFTVIAVFLLLLQLQQASVRGQTSTPLTNPITGPITSPITYFKISGTVTLNWRRLIKPFAGAQVEATNSQTQAKMSAYTNTSGVYSLPVVNGEYIVKVLPYTGYRFQPKERQVTVANQDVTGVNFQAKPTR